MSRTVRHIVGGMRPLDDATERWSVGKGADHHVLRELNRMLVLNYVREHGPIARVDLARRTGLSRTTVSAIMDGLLREGLVREGSTQQAASSGGRRAILVHFNAAAGYLLGVDMGRSHLTILICDLAAHILARYSGPFDVDRGPEECLPWLIGELRALLEQHHIPWSQVVGVGMGMPGPMDASLQRTIRPPRMPGWDGVDVRSILARELAVPIYLDNDANLGALGESRYGAGIGVPHLTYVKVGTGIGGGLVMLGHIYRGSVGSAGEIGHVTVDPDGPLCDCGNRGCLEAMVDAHMITRDAVEGISLRAGGAAPHDAASVLSPLRTLKAPEVEDVVNASLQGDPAAVAALTHAGELIGVVLAGLVNLINPSLILLGGSVARAGDLLLDPIRRAITARSFSVASAHLTVRAGALGDNATALGGVAMVTDAAFRIPMSMSSLGPSSFLLAAETADSAPGELAGPGTSSTSIRSPGLATTSRRRSTDPTKEGVHAS
jgi:glucokinase-like ROK family protein